MQPEGRILLVEDQSDWVKKLKAYLADEPYSIKVAKDFQGAADLLRDHVFDTVLVDLRLKHWQRDDFEGMEVLKLVDKIAREQGTTAIVISAYGRAQHVRKGFKVHGIIDYIDKTLLDPEALREVVRRAVDEAYLRRGDILDRKLQSLAHQFRCFKTWGECNRELKLESRQVFVAMPYKSDLINMDDVYEFGIEVALQELDYKPLRADRRPILGRDLMCNICMFIQESDFGIVDITNWNPNVLLELGMMFGWGKTAVIIKHEQSEVPSDLRGALYIEYASIGSLKEKLKSGLPNLEL